MAKTATPKKTATPAPAPAASETSAAPWAPAETPTAPVEGSIDPGPETSAAAAPEGEQPSEERDQLTPTGENEPAALTPGAPEESPLAPGDSTGDNDDADGEGGNGGDDAVANELDADEAAEGAPEGETTSEERDQETPSGTNPSKRVVDLASRIDPETLIKAPPADGERPAEVTDQVTPVGQDVALMLDDQRKVDLESSAYPTELGKLKDRMAMLSTEDQLALQAKVAEFAEETLAGMERGSEAQEMAARMVDGNGVFGNAARRENHDETLPTKNGNVERNRRARRAAERLERENAARGSKK